MFSGRGHLALPMGQVAPLGDTAFKLELHQSVYTHSKWNWHMCSPHMALSWHKNIERLNKLCGQEIPQTVKGRGVLPHPTPHGFLMVTSNERKDIQIHLPFDCLFRLKHPNSASLGLCEGNHQLPVTGGFPSQRTSNTWSVSMTWRHHGYLYCCSYSISS